MGDRPSAKTLLLQEFRAWLEALKFTKGYRAEWDVLQTRYRRDPLLAALASLRAKSGTRRKARRGAEAGLQLLGERWPLAGVGAVDPYDPQDRGAGTPGDLHGEYPALFLEIEGDGEQILPTLHSLENHALVLVDLRLSTPVLSVFLDEMRRRRGAKVMRLTKRRPWGSNDLSPEAAFQIRRLHVDTFKDDPARARKAACELVVRAGCQGRPKRIVGRVMKATGEMVRRLEKRLCGLKVLARVDLFSQLVDRSPSARQG